LTGVMVIMINSSNSANITWTISFVQVSVVITLRSLLFSSLILSKVKRQGSNTYKHCRTRGRSSERASKGSLNGKVKRKYHIMVQCPLTYRLKALVRDQFKCCLSGMWDSGILDDNRELGNIAGVDPQSVTQCAHIISVSVNTDVECSLNKVRCIATLT
jgi:hypothetical protein